MGVRKGLRLMGNIDTDEPSADAFGTLPYFLEFLGTVLLDGLFAKPFDEYNCKLFAGFEKEQVLPAR